MGKQIIEGVAEVELRADGIISICFLDGVAVVLSEMEKTVAAHVALAAGPHPALVDVRGVRSVDRASRQLVSGTVIAAVTTRLAVLVGGPVSAMIGNFFMKVDRPAYEARVFSDPREAEAWLLAASERREAQSS